MTQYNRPSEEVFASGAKPGEVQSFPNIARGWGVAFDQTAGIPPMEWFNALFQRTDEALRYLMQRGVPEWSATEDYPAGAYVQEGGKTWKAKLANINKRPSTNAASWVEWGLTRDDMNAAYATTSHGHSFASLTGKPTTVSGYGITDALATSAIQSSDNDATAGKILKVGGFGLGGLAAPLAANNIDMVTATGFYIFTAATVGVKPVAPTVAGSLIHIERGSSQQATQYADLLIGTGAEPRRYIRTRRADGVWSLWQEEWNTGNLSLVGAVMAFASPNPPVGWMRANGAAVSRTTYAALFAAIGTTYGAGDGSTTFNLPDLRGEFVRGWDNGRGVDSGRSLGSWQKGTLLTVDPSATSVGMSAPINGDDDVSQALVRQGLDSVSISDYAKQNMATVSASTLALNSNGFLSGSARPRNIALLYCIKY